MINLCAVWWCYLIFTCWALGRTSGSESQHCTMSSASSGGHHTGIGRRYPCATCRELSLELSSVAFVLTTRNPAVTSGVLKGSLEMSRRQLP